MIASALLLLVLAAGGYDVAAQKPVRHPIQMLGGASGPLFPKIIFPPAAMKSQFDTQDFENLMSRISLFDAIMEQNVAIGKPKHVDAEGFWNAGAAADHLTLQNKKQIETFRNDAASDFAANQTAHGKTVTKRDVGFDLGDNMLVFLVKDIIDDHANE